MAPHSHDNSMTEQGSAEFLECTGTQALKISGGTTNVRVYGSSTPVISNFQTPDRDGRKIRIIAASNTAASVVINDVSNRIIVASSTTTLAANQAAEFICLAQSDGTFQWHQTWTNGTSS